MNKDQKIYEKINEAIRILCDVYEILNEAEMENTEEESMQSMDTLTQFIKRLIE